MSDKKQLFERMSSIGQMPINENFTEPEKKHEGSMYIGDLDDISKNAQKFKSMLDANEELPAWVQDKITLANDYMDAISGWKESEAISNGINENINEEVPSAGNFISELQNIFHKYNHFITTDATGGIGVKNLEMNQEEYNRVLDQIEKSWNEISLPY